MDTPQGFPGIYQRLDANPELLTEATIEGLREQVRGLPPPSLHVRDVDEYFADIMGLDNPLSPMPVPLQPIMVQMGSRRNEMAARGWTLVSSCMVVQPPPIAGQQIQRFLVDTYKRPTGWRGLPQSRA
jgi:hypothetical protein